MQKLNHRKMRVWILFPVIFLVQIFVVSSTGAAPSPLPIPPGSSTPLQISSTEQNAIQKIIRANHPELLFGAIKVEKFGTDSLPQKGFYYRWQSEATTNVEPCVDTYFLKKGTRLFLEGAYREGVGGHDYIEMSDSSLKHRSDG